MAGVVPVRRRRLVRPRTPVLVGVLLAIVDPRAHRLPDALTVPLAPGALMMIPVCPCTLAGTFAGVLLGSCTRWCEVEPLPGGGASLQATENVWDYREERVRAVFRTLAPALPEGEPVKGFPPDTRRHVYADAADDR